MPLPAAGWYPDPAGGPSLRYWDGRAWTSDYAPMPQPAPVVEARMLYEPQQASAFDQELVAVVARGGRVEARTPTSAVVVTGRPVNHVLHLLVTVLLCGLWLPVWIILAIAGGEKRTMVSVDGRGHVQRTNRMPASPTANWLGRMSENQATLVVIAILIGGCLLVGYLASLMHH
ncbi:DUF2510 domain-containing protein [Mycobacterium sp. E1386]|uniref:DUF2510 domain-containing protein n=1 Tax=Mycobacterium sp. E1386 TaxID=1834126 RepID=UPI0009EE1498|nr:DUF2510 domain-containing protein [Mycobacterium sp. E1386]